MKAVRGIKKLWYKNGSIKEMFNTLNGKKEGEYTKFSEDGKAVATCRYISGKIHGVYKEISGEKEVRYEYKSGLRHGEQFEYVAGNIARKYHCYKGVLDGEYLIYTPPEQLMLKCYVTDGWLEGKLTYYMDGKKKGVYNYARNMFHGECMSYDGDKCFIGYFNKGVPIKKWKELDKNGKILKEYVSSALLASTIFKNIKWDIRM